MTLTYSDKPAITDQLRDILTHIRVNCTDLDVDKKYKLITGSRDISIASSTVEYSGVGFSPSAIILYCVEPTDDLVSWGIWSINSTSGNDMCIYQLWNGGHKAQLNYSIYINHRDGYGRATVDSVTSDSFKLAWSKSLSPSGTATFVALCIR